jgi:pimeloyl-ACP methyl ester carboxylesterase
MQRKAYYFDGKFGQLHYYKQGNNEDNVPLVCFHMSPYSGRYFEKFQAEMSTDRVVVCPDTPGYGGSDAPENPVSIEELTISMATLIEELGFGQIDLLGFHTGVLIATELANIMPDQVRKLVLPGIPLVSADKRQSIRKNYETPRPYFDEKDFLATKWNEAAQSIKEGWDDARKVEMFGDIMRAGFKSNWGFMAVFDYDIEDKIAAIKKPVLLPIADEILAASTRSAIALFKNVTVKEMPDIKADLFESCPNHFVDEIRKFLV